MIIRKLTQQDITQHDMVTSQAFSYSCDIYDKTSMLPCDNVLGAFDDDNKTLFADLEMNKKACFYGNDFLSCLCIGGVAAKPEHRGKGAVKALFNEIFDNTDCDISILYPFSDEYYRKFGYESVGISVTAKIPFSVLSGIERNNNAVLYTGENKNDLIYTYNDCARNYPLCFFRNNTSMFPENPYFEQTFTYYFKHRSFATFYVNREQKTLFVKEIYFKDKSSLTDILGFLRNYESNNDTIVFEKLPIDTPILKVVKELKKCEIMLQNTGSARILNIENVLKNHDYKNLSGEFTIQVSDIIERNNGIFKVNYYENNVTVEKCDNVIPDISFDILSASKTLLSGTENAFDLSFTPNVTINNESSDFFKVFTKTSPFFTDNF